MIDYVCREGFSERIAGDQADLLWVIAGVVLSIAGCVSPQQQTVQKEDLLAAAGFQVKIADTPQRLAAMKRLPPRFVTRVVNGQPVYLYADPLV